MDNRDTCSMKDRKKMDVWQWRILHVKKYSRLPEPFYHSNRIGLDFNVASNTKHKKIDSELLTNGVIREFCDFAKTVQNSKKYFITNILENNFDLGLENEQQRKDFTNRIHNKAKDLIKRRPEDKKEVFTLFDKPECSNNNNNNNNALNTVSTELKTESSLFEMDDTDDREHEESKFSQATSKGHMKTESVSKEMDGVYDDSEHKEELECSGGQPAEELMEAVVPPLFPCCEEIGLSLDVGSKQSLSPGLLTKGVMLELVHFTKILTGTHTSIVLNVLEHNFEFDLKSQKEKDRVLAKIVHMLDRRKRIGGKIVLDFENEPFSLQKKRKRPNVSADQLVSTDVAATLPTVNSNVNPPFASQPDEIGLCEGEEQTQIPRHATNNCDMEHEEMVTENNLWKLRANRVKQILSSPNFDAFVRSKRIGIEFDVGYGPKQTFSVDSMPNYVLLEVAKFALAMNSSLQDFIMEILEYNFDFDLQSQHQRNVLTCEIMHRVRTLRSCEDAVKFSKEVHELPGLLLSMNQSEGNPELSSECDVAPICPPHSHAEIKDHVSQEIVDLYPFCKEIGLNLQVNHSQPNKKLDTNKLTNGAMTEVTDFAEKLCGTFEQICLDILRHNFDLDLQSGDSDLARSLVAIVEQTNLTNQMNHTMFEKGPRKDFSTLMKLDYQNDQNVDACSAGSSQAAITEQNDGSSTEPEYQDEQNLKLWKLRANHIQQILSAPHVERCPLYSYSRCKKLGIDFNVGSGAKQNLDPKLLTNGIMVELNTFATELMSAQKHFVTEILEYNFHLDFNNELHRSAFALQVLYKIKATKLRMKMPFKLPDISCIQELPSYCPKCYQDRNHKLHEDESDPNHMHHPRQHTMSDVFSADANCTAQQPATDLCSIFSAVEEKITESYHRCKEIGLNLCVDKDQPKDKLDMHVLTHGVIHEVARFAKKLCGTKNKIINDVLEHNFNTSTQQQQQQHEDPVRLFQKVTHNHCWPDWFNEVYVMQQYSHKQPGHVNKMKQAAVMHSSERLESIQKRRLALQTKENNYTRPIESDQESDTGNENDMEHEAMGTTNKKMCPLESDLDSEKVTYSGHTGSQDHLQNPKSCSLSSDIPSESESNCLGGCAQFLTTTDISSSLSNVNLNMNPPLVSQTDQRGLCGVAGDSQTPRNAPNECDIEPEEMGTENNVWKVRANRVKQILSAGEGCTFQRSRKSGLEFNVGFSPKQNNSVNSLPDTMLLEVAKFALAMTSSQQFFIMEILEYNFDISLPIGYQRSSFACEIMTRVKKLKACEDAVNISEEVFQLPGPMTSKHLANQIVCSDNSELSCISRIGDCVAPICPLDSHAEIKEHVSQKNVDLYPFCKKLGLKLQVNNSQPNKKLDISKLTNGAMTEVAHLAEKLCGTFEQICLDILGHNFDLDLQSGEFDHASRIFARIPVVEQNNLLLAYKHVIRKLKGSSAKLLMVYQNNQHLDTCSAGSSQAAIMDQSFGNSTDIEHQNELNLKLWKLRANHIQQIISVPHLEHCPLYSYSRCKKLGIDFNVGSGVKQHLDPKLLTNGIMVELNIFATALVSAQKHFVTEILEYNFHLDFNNELHRSAFAQQTMDKIKSLACLRSGKYRLKKLFELSDIRCIQDKTPDKTTYCPKCYQDRNLKLHQYDPEGSDPGYMHHPRPHTMTDTVSSDANSAKDLSSTSSAMEEKIMESYHCCREMGLNLCVDKDQPKQKLDTDVMTRGVIIEVAHFAKKLCGTKNVILHAVLEHNFNIDFQRQKLDLSRLLRNMAGVSKLAWFSEVYFTPQCSHRPPRKLDEESTMQIIEKKEVIKKRKLALQTKEERATLPCHNISRAKKTKTVVQTKPVHLYPFCTEIGLDLEVTSKSEEKEKLDLELLTRGVMVEIHKFATRKSGCLRHIMYDILDYNFDISSQHNRRKEFCIATAFKVQSLVKQYKLTKYRNQSDKVFKLPFVFSSKAAQHNMKRKKCSWKDGVKTNKKSRSKKDPGMILQRDWSVVRVGYGSPLQGNLEIKEEEYDPYYGYMNPGPYTEERYHPYFDVKTVSITEDVEHSVLGEPTEPFGHTFMTSWPNSERQETESENENDQCYTLAQPQGSGIWPTKNIWTTEGVRYLVPAEAEGSEEYSTVTIGEDTESILIKEEEEEEEENEPVDS